MYCSELALYRCLRSSEFEIDSAVQLHLRIEIADRDADVGGRGMQLLLGRADVGAPARKFGRQCRAESRRRRCRTDFRAPSSALQRARRLIEQQAERIDVLRFLLLQLRESGRGCFRPAPRRFRHRDRSAALVAGDPATAAEYRDRPSDCHWRCRSASCTPRSCDIVPRKFRQARDQRIAPLVRRLIDLGVRRFDLAAHPAPEIELP